MKMESFTYKAENPISSIGQRSRQLLLAAFAATGLYASACSDSQMPTQPDSGSSSGGNDSGSGGMDAGMGGSTEVGGTGGMETGVGGVGGEGGESDPCLDVSCNGNGTCVNGACVCDAGFANDDMDAKDDCDSCDTESGLYENDYPTCSPDVTPPNAPVITTNGGTNTIIYQENFTLDGTTDADTYEVWYNIDGGNFSQLGGYPAYNTMWSYNGSIPSVFEAHDYCFRAEDKAGNQSGTDCINVNRFP